jgi:putative DNA primase/helicase
MSFALDNLSADERLAIAKDCFQVTEQRGHELHGLCPFHAEKQPSFSYNVEKDLCNCFSCGESGDLVTLWGQARGYGDNKDAFLAFREQHAPPDTPGKPASKSRSGGARSATRGDGGAAEVTKIIPEADYEKLAPLPEGWRQRCRDQFTWTEAAIEGAGLRLWKSVNGDERIAIPIRRDDGALVNIRLYKPGAVDNKVTSWGKGFGKSKLTPAPSTWSKSPILITEGEKDRITALSHGFNACTQTAGANSWDDKFTRFFSGRDAIIAYDADEKGAEGAQKVAKKLLEVAKTVRILTWPDYMGMGESHGQDLTDFFAVHHKTAQDLKDLIATSKPLKKADNQRLEAIPEDIQRFFGGSRGTQFKPRLVSDEILSWRRLIHDPRTGQIHTWNDRHWEDYDPSNIRRQILTLLDIEGSTPRCNDVLGIVRDLAVMPHGRQLNDQADMIPLENGMFCLESAQVQPHDPGHLNSYVLDITLQLGGKLPDCPTWRQFLGQSVGDPDTIRELQKFFGYCFTRETRYEKALLLIGPGGDGKGTILKVLQSLLGDINVSNVSMSGLQDQFHRVMLVDKLLNVATEIEAGLLQSDIFKTIVSGEAVTAAYKHKNAFSFAPVCKLAFSANKHPKLQDTSEGLYRRLLLIEMEKQFVKAGQADIYLLDKLMAERDGIFLWGLRGLQLLREEGFKPSDHMAGCLDRFQELNNPVLAFVRTHIDEDPDRRVCIMKVYAKYKKFCEKRGYKPLGESSFGVELRKVCPSVKRRRESTGKRRWGYQGINLVDDYDGLV